MTTNPDAVPEAPPDDTLLDRVRAATDLLERIVADRALLIHLPPEERMRLLRAAGHVYSPDNRARRRMVKATIRSRKEARVRHDEGVLGQTGIRTLRKQTVFTTPNVFPPRGFTQRDVEDDADHRES